MFRRAFTGEREIDLAFEGVDAGDEDAELIAEAEAAAGTAADEAALGGIEEVKVVSQRRDVDEAGGENVG
jgi:hypothetical protein